MAPQILRMGKYALRSSAAGLTLRQAGVMLEANSNIIPLGFIVQADAKAIDILLIIFKKYLQTQQSDFVIEKIDRRTGNEVQ